MDTVRFVAVLAMLAAVGAIGWPGAGLAPGAYGSGNGASVGFGVSAPNPWFNQDRPPDVYNPHGGRRLYGFSLGPRSYEPRHYPRRYRHHSR
jgi:hypothetical protein